MIFIARDREQLGQFPEDEVREGLRTGRFLGTDLAWREGMADWQPLSTMGFAPMEMPPLPPRRPPPEDPVPETVSVPTDARPAWEHPAQGNWLAIWFQSTLDLLFHPIQTFSRLPATGGMGRPLLYILLSAAISSPVLALLQIASNLLPPILNHSATPSLGLVEILVSLPVLMVSVVVGAVIGLYLQGAVLHVCLLIVGGARNKFQATLRALAYATGATYALNAIPILGWIASAIWGMILCAVSLKEIHRTVYWRVILAMLLPLLLFTVVVTAIVVFAVAVLGKG